MDHLHVLCVLVHLLFVEVKFAVELVVRRASRVVRVQALFGLLHGVLAVDEVRFQEVKLLSCNEKLLNLNIDALKSCLVRNVAVDFETTSF